MPFADDDNLVRVLYYWTVSDHRRSAREAPQRWNHVFSYVSTKSSSNQYSVFQNDRAVEILLFSRKPNHLNKVS